MVYATPLGGIGSLCPLRLEFHYKLLSMMRVSGFDGEMKFSNLLRWIL